MWRSVYAALCLARFVYKPFFCPTKLLARKCIGVYGGQRIRRMFMYLQQATATMFDKCEAEMK